MMGSNGNEMRMVREIRPRNLLSFGPDTEPIALESLNVLIGPNGSGKSNLIEAISLLRAAPSDIRAVIRQGGGAGDWIWKGKPDGEAYIEVVITNPRGSLPLRHLLAFREENQTFRLADERIENKEPHRDHNKPYFYYSYQDGNPVINVRTGERDEQRKLKPETVEKDQSILAQRRDPEAYPEVSYLASVYDKIKIYREWYFGRNAIFREPQKADMRNDRLEEDFSNLGLFLNRLRGVPKAKKAVLEALHDLYEGLDDFDVSIEGGTVQVFFTEGDFTIPATRLSDGTLRYLCMLAILCDPTPPPLICIEEPELGLHPDILPKVADLLNAASERTQLIVTTHSDILVDAMTERPEAVLVCEKHHGQTEIRRLDGKKLEEWLKDYRLGELWTRGALGGTRW
ncbi:AAA family ATPase [Methanotrichaceae archaeon Mx]|uniref:AAA family ATPase n=2 Tax=Candidatus Methanocrinis natronophilus TaxID=3033396 RepID=A0ABT5X640_9EURY|nr:AAA family ATPase [Candidatus Methanocrinis natronophilus]MDF0590164.1 AAA family ATPase [Candidatus Methanocrinis natronophilus]